MPMAEPRAAARLGRALEVAKSHSIQGVPPPAGAPALVPLPTPVITSPPSPLPDAPAEDVPPEVVPAVESAPLAATEPLVPAAPPPSVGPVPSLLHATLEPQTHAINTASS